MNFTTISTAQIRTKNTCLVLAVQEENQISRLPKPFTDKNRSDIASLIKQRKFHTTFGEVSITYTEISGTWVPVILLGLGSVKNFDKQLFNGALDKLFDAILSVRADTAYVCVPRLNGDPEVTNWCVKQLALRGTLKGYRYGKASQTNTRLNVQLNKVCVAVEHMNNVAVQGLLDSGSSIGRGANLARKLGDLPPNICTPSYLSRVAKDIASRPKMKVRVLGERDINKLGMGAFLAVSRGSSEEAKLIELRYNGSSVGEPPIVLVGKGITFDTGGISIKPSSGMDEMKYDMSGAGSVLGTLQAISELRLPINVVGLIAAAENMPSGTATRPGDVVTSMSGITVEILNTDAEGRLVLCDALTYAEKFKPAAVIDLATLTGACVVALGKVASGLFSNNQLLAEEIAFAGSNSLDRVWPMPIWEDYHLQLKSNFADLANVGGRDAGSITAACFLSKFAKNYQWAHLDIAGTAWHSAGTKKGSTGRPVPLLCEFLISRAARRKQ